MSVRVPEELAQAIEAEAMARGQTPGRRIKDVLEKRGTVGDSERKLLEETAARRSASVEVVIRDAIEALVEKDHEHDPRLNIIGVADDHGPTDGSINHDHYIYDDPHGEDKKNWPP
jgi:hypothetical protein